MGRIEQRDLPQRRAAKIGVEGINAVVFGGDEDDVVRGAADCKSGQIKRLGFDSAIDGEGEEFAEVAGANGSRGEYRLAEVLACPGKVVMLS